MPPSTPLPAPATKTYRVYDLKLPLEAVDPGNHASELSLLRDAVANHLGLAPSAIESLRIHKRGYDMRKKSDPYFVYTVDVMLDAMLGAHLANPSIAALQAAPDMAYALPIRVPIPPQTETNTLDDHPRPVVIGAGPCGLFAALILAQCGLRPLVLERGRKVRERTQDTWGLWRKGVLDTRSNVQFGEGGAGTFSDGKLYSQIKDPRFLARKVLEEMVKGGAPEEILYVSKPHIGTFRLVKVVQYLRREILRQGGEIRFETQVIDLHIETDASGQRHLVGLTTEHHPRGLRQQIDARHVVLAIGHSARDTFEALNARSIFMQAKPFSVGFRIEHPQSLIDRARFGFGNGLPERVTAKVGSADYKLVYHATKGIAKGRSVYSFCMCPGGTVVAATSEEGHVVTNGMSQYSRNERNANAGIVVGIDPSDYPSDGNAVNNVLAGMRFQQALEVNAYVLGGSNYHAPVQRVGDFLAGRLSSQAGSVYPSYQPGVCWTDLTGSQHLGDTPASAALPPYAIAAIKEALPVFGQQIKGFDAFDAVLTGVESRTSSPVRITRNPAQASHPYESLNTGGLYPAGEGAGYAGGIMSAAIDGIQVAEQIAKNLSRHDKTLP